MPGSAPGASARHRGGIGVVEAAIIAALVVAGVRPAQAVATELIYELVNSKSTVTAMLLVHRFIGQLRECPAA